LAGGALGAALAAWRNNQLECQTPPPAKARDEMRGALLGPEFPDAEVQPVLEAYRAQYTRHPEAETIQRAAELLAAGKAVGWVQGRMEFGPRALGNRSILADPRLPEMQRTLNLKVKKRESFRPFAPAVLRERLEERFDLRCDSPYMLLVAPALGAVAAPGEGFERLEAVQSALPAVTHVDGSARVQTVSREDNPRFYELLCQFAALTGCPVLLNTSFNIRGEPIVCSPEDAYRCFLQTELDYLVLGNFVLDRALQPRHEIRTSVELD
jgi:carbamoyltransferase